VERGVFLGGQHSPSPRCGEAPAFPNFGVPFYFCLHILTQNGQIWHAVGACFQGSATPHPKVQSQALFNFALFSHLCLRPLTQNDHVREGNTLGQGAEPRRSYFWIPSIYVYTRNDQIRHGNTCGEGRVLWGSTTPLHIAQMCSAVC